MAKITDLQGRPHSGIVPYAVVAIVTDNVDPDELGRIQVKFPTLHEEPLSFWLRQVAPMAGKERGVYALPEIDDEVLVIFLQGSHDVGIIIGQFWNGVDLPPPEAKDGMPKGGDHDTGATWSTEKFTEGSTSLDNNDRRFWKSRAGTLVAFDDTEGSETLQLWDKDHKLSLIFDTAKQAVFLANTGGDMHVRTKGDLYLEAGGEVKMKAKADITIDSDANVNIKAATKATMEAGSEVLVKSNMVNIKGTSRINLN
jgi:uncharacterized protein involved in type VI secretion and phage assembly